MSILNKEQENKFVMMVLQRSMTEAGTIDKIGFYDMFWDFVTDEEIDSDNHEILEAEERRLFRYCYDRGYLNVGIERVLENNGEIESYFYTLKHKFPFVFFHFSFYFEDEDNMSLNEIYEKWNDKCPGGWFSNYCICGSFTPKTPELATITNEWMNGYDINEQYYPMQLHVEDISKMEIFSNNILRFHMANGLKYNCKVYVEMKTASLLELCT